jgi:hypothetical protein
VQETHRLRFREEDEKTVRQILSPFETEQSLSVWHSEHVNCVSLLQKPPVVFVLLQSRALMHSLQIPWKQKGVLGAAA